jgi:hypothetical protein
MAGAVLLFAAMSFAQLGTTNPNNNVNVTVAAEAALTLAGDASLTSSGTNFADYTGTTSFTYFVRTSVGSGTGNISMKVLTDFSPAGGPSVASPLTASDKLHYTNTISAPGSAAAPADAAMTDTSVATFGADAHSAKAGNSGSTSWTLSNDPLYKTGSYSAVVQYTISAV